MYSYLIISLLPMRGECIWEFLWVLCNQCICAEILERCRQVENLVMFAKSQPHAAFSTFAHCVISGWMFFMRMVPVT